MVCLMISNGLQNFKCNNRAELVAVLWFTVSPIVRLYVGRLDKFRRKHLNYIITQYMM